MVGRRCRRRRPPLFGEMLMPRATENPGMTGIAAGASKIDHAGAAVETDHSSKMEKCQRGGFWSGEFATAHVEGRRLRFFAPAVLPAFPSIALRDLVASLTEFDHRHHDLGHIARTAFASEIRWRRSGWGVVRAVPLWAGLVLIEWLSDEGDLAPSRRRQLLAAFADTVRSRVGAVSDEEGGAIVSLCLTQMTAEAEAAAARIGPWESRREAR